MAPLLRHLAFLPLFLFATTAQAQNKALPLTASASVVPALVDVVSFNLRTDSEDHKLIVTPTATLARVDAPSDGYSIIYNTQTQHYFGLENRNYTWWEFSWPEVRTAVESTKRYESRLHEVGADALNPPSENTESSLPGSTSSVVASLLDTNASPANSSGVPPTSDDSGYVWTPTTDKKRIAGLECVRWNGQSLSGGPVDAWCYAGPLPKVTQAVALLRTINEPIALVPVRNLVPPFAFEVWDSLTKGSVTPLLITWGDEQDRDTFEVVSVKTREGEASLFNVPKLYMKTTLITMDGIGNQKAPGINSPPPSSPEEPHRPHLP